MSQQCNMTKPYNVMKWSGIKACGIKEESKVYSRVHRPLYVPGKNSSTVSTISVLYRFTLKRANHRSYWSVESHSPRSSLVIVPLLQLLTCFHCTPGRWYSPGRFWHQRYGRCWISHRGGPTDWLLVWRSCWRYSRWTGCIQWTTWRTDKVACWPREGLCHRAGRRTTGWRCRTAPSSQQTRCWSTQRSVKEKINMFRSVLGVDDVWYMFYIGKTI